MKLASSVEVAVAVKCDKKLKIAHRGLDGRATAIIPRRFVLLSQFAVCGAISTPRFGVWFAHITFFPIYFVVLALSHLLIFWDIIASLLSYIIDQRYRISLIERNFILLLWEFFSYNFNKNSK